MNVGEYNTLDLVKDITKKKAHVFLYQKGHNVLFQPRRNLDSSH